jgi:hypothetical protein
MAGNQRLGATITIGSVLSSAVGRHLGSISGGLARIGAEMNTVRERQRELARQRRVLEREGRSVEELDREYAELERRLRELTRQQERYRRAQEASVRVGATYGRMVRQVGGFARRAAEGFVVLGGAIVGVTTAVASQTEELNRNAKRLGVSTEFLSQMQFAAGKFGVENDALVDGLKELSLRADEFAVTGKGSAAEAFERIGISAKEAGELASDTAALFAVVRDRMSEVTDSAARQRISDELFGGTGAEQMIEFLSISRAEVEALGAEATKAGATVTEAQASMARDYTRNFNRLGKVIEGLTRTVANEVMPTLTKAFGEIGDLLIDNIGNAKALGVTLAEGVKTAIPAIRDLASGLGGVATKVGAVILGIKDIVGGWENFGIAIGVLMASGAILSFITFIGSIAGFVASMVSLGLGLPIVASGVAAIGVALTANPIGASIAAIAIGATLIIANWGKIKEFFAPVLEWLGEKFDWLMSRISPLIEGAKTLGSALSSVFGDGGDEGQAPPVTPGARGRGRRTSLPAQVLAPPGSAAAASVVTTNQITINAANMTPQEMVTELERHLARSKDDALYDSATSAGQYGGGL